MLRWVLVERRISWDGWVCLNMNLCDSVSGLLSDYLKGQVAAHSSLTGELHRSRYLSMGMSTPAKQDKQVAAKH